VHPDRPAVRHRFCNRGLAYAALKEYTKALADMAQAKAHGYPVSQNIIDKMLAQQRQDPGRTGK
jgi:hypothetical protein